MEMVKENDFDWYNFTPNLDDEVKEQEREVFQFRSVERYIPSERSYE